MTGVAPTGTITVIARVAITVIVGVAITVIAGVAITVYPGVAITVIAGVAITVIAGATITVYPGVGYTDHSVPPCCSQERPTNNRPPSSGFPRAKKGVFCDVFFSFSGVFFFSFFSVY